MSIDLLADQNINFYKELKIQFSCFQKQLKNNTGSLA